MAAGLVEEETGALASNEGMPEAAAKVGSISGVGNGERTMDDDPRGSGESMGSPSSNTVEKDAEASGPIWDSGRKGGVKNGPLGLPHEGNGGAPLDDKCLRKCEDGAVWSSGGEERSVFENMGRGFKKKYSRGELEEALRFLGTDEQRRRWKEVYGRLGSVVAQEYDRLCVQNPKKQKRAGKKKETSTVFGLGEIIDPSRAHVDGKGKGAFQPDGDCQCSLPDTGEERKNADSPETTGAEWEPLGNGSEQSADKIMRERKDIKVSLSKSEEKNGELRFGSAEPQWIYENKGMGFKRRYLRSELEALRFMETDKQQQRWKEVYHRLDTAIAREYDGIEASNPPKKQQHVAKEKETSFVVGEVLAGNAAESLEVLDMSNLAFGDTVFGDEHCAVIEELCDQYESINDDFDSSEDEYDSIRKPAFFVDGEPNFDSGPPLDGLEYVRRVRWEASQIPKVKVAKLNLSKLSSEQTPYMPKIPEIAKCPQNLLPMKCWEDAFLAEFSDLRQAFARLDSSGGDRSAAEVGESSCKRAGSLQQPKCLPTLPLVLRMDTVARAATLRNYISMVEGATELTRDDCLWLFALCVALDAPLHADTSASLRCLLRKCSSLLAVKSEPDDEVAMLNILLVITGKYFGQSENLED